MINNLHGAVGGPVVQAHTITGDVRLGGGVYAPPPPQQVPLPPSVVVNRARQIAVLTDLAMGVDAGGGPAVALVYGPAGIGMTTVVAWVLQQPQVRAHFDGVLYTRWAGLGAGPHRSMLVLGRWLRALGVPADCVPADRDEVMPLWRSITAGRRLAVVIDDVETGDVGEQVVDLLPGLSPALVIVTAHALVPALMPYTSTSTRIEVPLLTRADAGELVRRIAGAARQSDPAWEELLGRCGGLPAAVVTAAALLAAHPEHTITDLLSGRPCDDRGESLPTSSRAINEGPAMDAGRPSAANDPIPALVQLAYDGVSVAAQTMLRRLSHHPGPDFHIDAAAAAASLTPPTALRHLGELHRAQLLSKPSPGRYMLPAAVQAHALRMGTRVDPPKAADQALRAMIAYYRATARSARAAAVPYLDDRVPKGARVFPDQRSAMVWFDAEHTNLVATADCAHACGRHTDAVHIIDAMWPPFLYWRLPDWVEVDQLGVQAAQASGDIEAQARMLDRLGLALLTNARDPQQAEKIFRAAQRHWIDLGVEHKIAGSLRRLGEAATHQGNHHRAVALFTKAAREHQRLGDARSVALARIGLGQVLIRSGAPDKAVRPLAEATDALTHCSPADPYNQARAGIALGEALTACRQSTRAGEILRRALEQMKTARIPHGIADAYAALAALAALQRNRPLAADYARLADQTRTGHSKQTNKRSGEGSNAHHD